MTDVTDSYCERCGARYVFNPIGPKTISLKGARLLAKGLKNFVLTDGQSMADSLALARHDDDHQDSSRMTEAFHRTFNFCMTCRQYACDKCWNSRVGACLSCAPEAGLKPVEPQDHLIVRTPVARWDTNWSLFPDGPAVEPVGRPEAFPRFDEPIRPPESRPAQGADRSAPQVWPVADLPTPLPAGATGPTGKSSHRSSRKPVDAEAASLWPLADEIAPEMTLTPEELELVEFKLGQDETPQGLAPSLHAVGQQPAEQQPVERAPEVQAPLQHLLRMPAAKSPQPLQANPAPQSPSGEHTPIVARLLGRRGPETAKTAKTEPRRSRGRQNQPPGDPWPHATRWSERPDDAQDWWGDADAAADAAAAAFAAAAVAATTANAHEQPPAEPALSAAASGRHQAEPESEARPAPQNQRRATGPTRSSRAEVDARSAAAVRLSAVGASAEQPVASTDPGPSAAAAASATPESPDWLAAPFPEADWQEPDLDGVATTRPAPTRIPGRPTVRRPAAAASQMAAEPSAPHPAPPSPWPPLGASWPAQEDPGAPWPGPEVVPVPAALAAQEAGAQTLAEIWATSSEEVLNRGSVRVCHRCALPVSTQARFCRRCGTRQA